MTNSFPAHFSRQYDSHLKHRKLKGLQPKTIDAYARAIRRLGGYFDYRIEALTEAQLTEYFSAPIATHPWSALGNRKLFPGRRTRLVQQPVQIVARLAITISP